MDVKWGKSAHQASIMLYDFRQMHNALPWQSVTSGLDPPTFGYMTSSTIPAYVSPLVLRMMLNPSGPRMAGSWRSSRAVKVPQRYTSKNSTTQEKDNHHCRQDFVGRGIGPLMEDFFFIAKTIRPQIVISGSYRLTENRSLIRFSKLSSWSRTLNFRPMGGGLLTFRMRRAMTSSMSRVSITPARGGAFRQPAPLNL